MSIASRITSIEEHIGNAYDKLDDLGIDLTNVDKNIENIAEMLDTVYQDYPKVPGTGTEITLNGTKAGKLSLDVKGNSTQETTTGKNLFDNTIIKKSQGNYEIIEDTTIPTGKRLKSLSSTVTSGTIFLVYAVMDLTNYVGKTIRFKANFTPSASNRGRYYIGLCNSDGSNRNAKSTINTSGGIASFVVPELTGSQTYLCLALYCNTEAGTIAQNNYVDYTDMILTIDNSDMTYEPYTNGASPNPSYPQTIYSAGDDINLFDKNNANIINAYINNGTITEASNGKSLYISCKPNTTYTILRNAGTRFKAVDTSVIPAVGVVGSDYVGADTSSTITITTNASAKYLCVNYYNRNTDGANEQSILDSIKIAESTTVTPYSPYGMGTISEKIVNKNWLPTDVSDWEQGSLSTTGLVSSTTRIRTKEYYFVKFNTSYYVSIENTNYCFLNIYFYDINKNYVEQYYTISQAINGTRGMQINVPNNSNIVYMKVILRNTNNSATITPNEITDIKPMIVEGTTRTDFVAHQEQTYTIPCQQPMRKIGDVRDEFIQDTNGNWFERHKYRKYIFTGTENWQKSTKTQEGFVRFYFSQQFLTIAEYENYQKSNILSSITNSQYSDITDINEGINVVSSGINLKLKTDNNILTVADLKTYLNTLYNNGTPAYVIYRTNILVDLPCTSEQISILENLPKSYNEQTNIYSLDVTPAYFDASALKA